MDRVIEERTFSEVRRLCHSGLDGPDLLREVVGRLRRAIPFDAHCASLTDPGSCLITHAMADGMGGEKEAAIFLDRLYFEYDLDRIRAMTHGRRPVALLSGLAGGPLERSPRYQEMLRPLGLAHEMRSVFAGGGSPWGTLDLSREAGAPDFGPREVSLMKRLAPHLGAGLKAATLRSRASDAEGDETDIPGVLTLDHEGRVVQNTPAAEYWLRQLGDLRPGWREGAGLPVAVRMVSGKLRKVLGPASDHGPGDGHGDAPRVRVRTLTGRWLALYGSLTEASPGRPSETVIVIEPAKPEEVVVFSMAAYGLSPREEEIARLVMGGSSTKEISTALHISEYTVQNHLANVFEKAGVRSRGELLKRLFFENLYPSLFG